MVSFTVSDSFSAAQATARRALEAQGVSRSSYTRGVILPALLLSNWRPLGLSNSIAKLYHACLADILYRFATAAGILSDTQYGFRRRERNCQQALQYVYGLFEDARCTRRPLYAAYIDFADAFGSVQLDVLVEILKLY